jgi:hypothetical protein
LLAAGKHDAAGLTSIASRTPRENVTNARCPKQKSIPK